MEIRRARLGDVPRLVEMARAMHDDEDSTLGDIPRYPVLGTDQSIADDFAAMLKSNGIFIAVADMAGKLVGFIKGCIEIRTTLMPPLVTAIHGIYVHPDMRRKDVAGGLIRALKQWIESVNITLGQEHVQYAEVMARPGKMARSYVERGWTPFGVLFWKRIKEDQT